MRTRVNLTALLILFTAAACATQPSRRPTSQEVRAAVAASRDAVAIVFPDTARPGLAGSGVFISPDGLMLTNDHVIDYVKEGQAAVVYAYNQRQYRARIIGRDSFQDIALIQVFSSDPEEVFPYVELGDSDAVRVGDWVMAIGNPLGIGNGDGRITVTLGVLGAKHRMLAPLGAEKFARYTDGLQGDFALHPGNSGGALVDLRGYLLGINGAGGKVGMMGFAIPVNQIKRYLPKLKAGETIAHADLQVEGRNLNAKESGRLGRGAFRISKHSTPDAVTKNLKRKDFLLSIGGQPVYSYVDMMRQVDRYDPGDTVEVALLRAGKPVIEHVTLGKVEIDLELIKKSREFAVVHDEALKLLTQKNYPEAIEKFLEAMKVMPENPTAYYNMACAYSLTKDADRALENIKKAYDLGMDNVGQLLTDPDLNHLRSDPRFQPFYEEVKRKEEE